LVRTDLVQHLVALIQDEPLHTAQAKLLLADEGVEATRGGDDDVWVSLLVGEELLVLLDVGATVEDRRLNLRHVLAEALVLVADLEGQLTGVAHDEN